ncbi:MAG: rRNA pseudouridine synthase [Dehalococcoidia bacterium]|nr:rRNA pseudouridine synthase [Dehalococcoidia bacterium]
MPRPLLKLLLGAGLGSRRRLADAIRQGKVQVNGDAVEDFMHPVDVERDTVTLNGRAVDLGPEPLAYVMLNKPAGVLATTRDERGRKTITELLPPQYRDIRLYPVGRLDKDSTGLLLLTNDGTLTYQLTHPRFEHEKEYFVQVQGALTPAERKRLERGIELEDGVTHGAVVRELKAHRPFNYSITVHEGRKRQVRRMFGAVGHPVLALKRVRVGSLTLGGLNEGQARELTVREVEQLQKPGGRRREMAPGRQRSRRQASLSQGRLTG